MNDQNNSSALSNWFNDVIRDVAELPDRDSPADAPDMMLVSGDELREIIAARAPKMTREEVDRRALLYIDAITFMRAGTVPTATIDAVRNLYAAELAQYPELAAKVRAA